MDVIAVVLILITWYLRAFSDAIDHKKGGRSLYELWHISELAIHGSLYIYIAIVAKIPIIWLIITVALLLPWDVAYKYFRDIRVDKLDDKFKCKWIRTLLRFKREDAQ